MANLNKIFLMGNLTRDPELSYLPSQTSVVEFGMAVNRKWKNKDGEQKEEVCFVECRCYGNQAESIQKYLHKGSKCLVEGHLQLDTWKAKDGTNRSKHRVFIENCTFMDPPKQAEQAQTPHDPNTAIEEDDIPF